MKPMKPIRSMRPMRPMRPASSTSAPRRLALGLGASLLLASLVTAPGAPATAADEHSIAEVQGTGATSPFTGQQVSTSGVVKRDDSASSYSPGGSSTPCSSGRASNEGSYSSMMSCYSS